ncbi:hypothetical protein Tco_1201173 [Tanacetum coccineum]
MLIHGLQSEDPNQHLKDFLKLVDLLDLDGENRRTVKLRNRYPDVPTTSWRIFSKGMTHFKTYYQSPVIMARPLLPVQIFYDHSHPVKPRLTIDQSVGVALYDNSSIAWKIPNKPLLNTHPHVPMKQEVSGLVSNFMASQDSRLSKFEANFKQQQSEMTNKIDTVLKAITDQITGTLPSDTFDQRITIHTEQQSTSYDDGEKENKEEEDDPENIHVNPPTPPDPSVTFITEKVLKFNSFFESLGLVPPSSNTELICTKEEDGDVMFYVRLDPGMTIPIGGNPKHESKK